MGTLLGLAEKLEKAADAQAARANAVSINAATAMLKQLIFSTPVDTSQALSNWQVGVGAPARGFIRPYFFGSKGSTRSASGNEAYAVGVARLRAKKPGEPVYLSNNAPYIESLNNGTLSSQPGGFVEAALLVGKKIVEAGRK